MRIGSRAVKKLLLVGVGSALMFTMGGVGPAAADAGPHRSTAVGAGQTALISNAGGGRCASCHRAHTAKAEFLLKAAQPALCYTCHNGAGASTNVIDGVDADTNDGLRGGGFQNAKIDGAGASKTVASATGVTPVVLKSASVPALGTGAAVTSKHQIDGTTSGTIWGNGAVSATVNPGKAGVTLECGSCHDPHGNGNYRILKPVPVDAGALTQTVITPASTNATTGVVTPAELSAPAEGVKIPDATTKVYTTSNYWDVTDRNVPNVAGVALATTETDGYITNVAQWCSTCHTRYLAGSGSYKTPLTDPTTGAVDAVFTYRHRSNRNNSAGVSRPNCIQCHVSHGSNVAMSGDAAAASLPGGATLAPTDAGYGDSKLLRVNNRGTCVMCHNV
jgi:predicted CXXCH cytochrome family protein